MWYDKMRMRIFFYGASEEVTGSCFLVETGNKKILVDCGMFQGSNFNEGKNLDDFPFKPSEISAVLVTHAHLDHIGRIPRLVKMGFAGHIFMTKPTKDFCKIIWEDAYEIMSENQEKYGFPVLYEPKDIAGAALACRTVEYGEENKIFPGLTAIFKDAGHIFGSAFIEVTAEGKSVGFSGDIGNKGEPIVRDTEKLGNVDALLCESTYGDREHEDIQSRKKIISDLILKAAKRGGTIMVPAFSLERTQEFLYELNELSEHDKILPDLPIFVDSPLAIEAISVYKKYPQYYDTEASKLHFDGDDFFAFPNLHFSYTREESKAINKMLGPKMVIAGAGMMNGGRITHHALRYLPDEKSTLLIIGYQAEGTLGRKIFDGAPTVEIFGETVPVRCKVKALGALSAHADKNKLSHWVGEAKKIPNKVFCVHGEKKAAESLAEIFKKKYGIQAVVPKFGESAEV